MDIDDILADIDAPHASSPSSSAASDLQTLARAWVAERAAPELLEWPGVLMERVMERIAKQIELVEEQTGKTDPQTNFKLVVMQTDLERTKFMVRSFLRARLSKIDRFPIHYATPPHTHLLSPSEAQYLAAHQALLQAHYSASFMSQFPDNLRGMEDTNGGMNMIDEPDVDSAVFVRVLRDVPGEVRVRGTDVRMEMRRGDVWVVRWSAVRDVVERGDAELL